MADSNVNINVNASTGQAVNELGKVQGAFKNIEKSMKESTSKMFEVGKSIKNVGKNLYSVGQRATAGISLPLATAQASMVNIGAEMKAMGATFEVVFDDMSDEARAWSVEMGEIVGLSGGVLDKTQLAFGKMGSSFGLAGTDLTDFTKKFTALTLDLAAFNDVSIEESTQAMIQGLKGSSEAVEKLGLFTQVANLDQQALSMGYKKGFQPLDDITKREVMYALMLKQSAKAKGQASRESESYQNSLANVKQAFAELSEKYFIAVEPALLGFMTKVTDVITKLKELTPEQWKAVSKFALWATIIPPIIMYLGAFVESVGRIIEVMDLIPKAFKKVFGKGEKEAVKGTGGLLKKVGGSLKTGLLKIGGIVSKGLSAIGSFFLTLGWWAVLIVALVAIVVLVVMYWDEIKAWTIKAWNSITEWLTGAWNNIVDTAVSVWSSITDFFAELWQEIVDIATNVWTAISDFFIGIWESIVSMYDSYVQPVVDAIGSVFSAIGTAIETVASVIGNVVDFIAGIFNYLAFDIIAPIVLYIGGFLIALGDLFIWIAEQVIGMAIDWIAKKWDWFYTSVIRPVGVAIIGIVKSIGEFFVMLYEVFILGAVRDIMKVWNDLKVALTILYNNTVVPILKWMGDTWSALAKLFMDMYKKYIVVLIAEFKLAWEGVKKFFFAFTESLKKEWDGFVRALKIIWDKYGKPLIDSMKKLVEDFKQQWSKAWDYAKDKFQKFIDGIKRAWNSIKNWFKMPHLSISGSWDLTPPNISVPKFNVDWYAKGGIFSSASVIGVGEAGDEAVVPLNNKSKVAPFASAVASQFKSLLPDNFSSNSGSGGGDVVITGNSFVVREEADIKKVALELNKLQDRGRRGKGRNLDV